MRILRKLHAGTKRFTAVVLAAALSLGAAAGASAKTTHDELDYTVTVGAKRSTVTIDPNVNPVVDPGSGDTGGTTGQFTVTGKIGSQVTINAGAGYSDYIHHLEESDTSMTNVVGFTYTFGPGDETVTVRWKEYTTNFDGNGGTAGAASVTREYGHTAEMPNASRTGYTFDGWFTAASGGTNAGGAGTVYTQTNAQPTYYAHWTCTHPTASQNTSYSSWVNHSGTQHKRTKTVTCGVCGATLSTTTEYGSHGDGNHDGKCDGCGVAMTTGSFTCKYIKSTPSGNYNEAYGNVDEAPGHQKSQSVTYWPVSKAQSSFSDFGSYYIKKSGGGTHFKHTFVGWSTACNNRFSGGWSTVTSNPSEYADITAAANAGYTGTLYAVYKYTRNSTTYYVCAK